MSPRVIYEDDQIQLLHLPGNKPVALVTFAALGVRPNGKSFFGMMFCKDADIEGYGFVAKGPSLYPPSSVLKAIASGVINPGKPIVTYGGSSGTWAALRFAGDLKAAATIATAPVYSVDPAIIPEDNRFLDLYISAWHRGRKVELKDMTGRIMLFYDPRERLDAYHVNFITKDYAGNKLDHVHVNNIGHFFLPDAQDRVLLSASIDYALNGGDLGDIFRLAKQTKKKKHRYGCVLAEKLVRRNKPELALRVLESVQNYNGAPGDLDSRVRRAKVSADAYMALAMRSAAIAQIEEALAVQPRDPQLLERLADSLYADGRIDPALQAWRKAIEHASNNQRLQKRLQEALDRALRHSAALTVSGEAIAS